MGESIIRKACRIRGVIIRHVVSSLRSAFLPHLGVRFDASSGDPGHRLSGVVSHASKQLASLKLTNAFV